MTYMNELLLRKIDVISPHPIHLRGMDLAGLSLKLKRNIASQVLTLLEPHAIAGHMVRQTISGLVEYIQRGHAAVMLMPKNKEVFGFAKLHPYQSQEPEEPPVGYEFSTWLSKYPKKRIGYEILLDSMVAFKDQENPNADLFAVCSSANKTPQDILLAAGGELMQRPSYVPNMLAAQSGSPYEETCIDLKPILRNYYFQM